MALEDLSLEGGRNPDTPDVPEAPYAAASQAEPQYEGLTEVSDTQYKGGTSIKYWM